MIWPTLGAPATRTANDAIEVGNPARERVQVIMGWNLTQRRRALFVWALVIAMLVSGSALIPPVGDTLAATSCARPATHSAVPTATPAPAATTTSATPIAKPRNGSPDDAAELTADLEALARALAACLSANDAAMVATLTTASYLGNLYGSADPLPKERYLAAATDLDPIPMRIVSVTNAAQRGTGAATAEVLSVIGNQLIRSEWDFVQAPADEREAGKSAWQVNAERELALKVPSDSEVLDVRLTEWAITIDPTTTGPNVVLQGTNTGKQDHEMLVLRLKPGFTVQDLLRAAGPGLPDEVTFVGQRTVASGGSADLILTELPKGEYLVTSLFSAPDGTPELAKGMSALFTVR